MLAEPLWQQYIFSLLSERMVDLIELVNSVAFSTLDSHLAKWLMGRLTVQLQGSDNKTSEYVIHISHQKIAEDLASSREVISRLLKKFELEGLFKQVVFLKYRSLLEIKLILPISTR